MHFRFQPFLKALLLICFSQLLLIGLSSSTAVAASEEMPLQLTTEERAWLKAHPKIRLGIDPSFPPFEFAGRDGAFAGMSADYLALINGRLGTDMQIVPGLSWAEVMDRAKKQEIDALPTLGKTAERSAYLSFTSSYLNFPVVFLTRKDKEPVSEFDDLAGRKLAMVKDYFYVEEILRKHPDIDPYFVNTPLEAMKALSTGKVDAALANFAVANHLILKHDLGSIRVDSETDIIGSEFGYGVRKDWPELVTILDKVLASISEKKYQKIRDRWITYSPKAERNFGKITLSDQLTVEERAWLKAHPVIRVSSESDYAPFDFQIDGEPVGYSTDYVKLLAKRLGIRIEFVNDTWDNLLKKAENRELDLVHTIFNSPAERENYLNFTKPYKRVINAIVARDGITDINSLKDLNSKTVALVKADSVAMLIPNIVPDARHQYYDDYSAVLKAVSLGKADAAVLELPTSVYLIRQLSLTNLKIAVEVTELGNRDQSYRLAVRKDWPLFVSILEKAMDSVQPGDLTVLESRWMTLPSSVKGAPSVVLTNEERAWLAEHPVIRVHNESDWPPFNYFEDGEPQGLSIDYMNLMASKFGLKVEYVSGPSWGEFIEMMKRGELDVMLNIVKTQDRLKYLLFTQPYANNPNTILSKTNTPYHSLDELVGKTVSVPKGFFYEEVLAREYPQIKVLPLINTIETMKAVSFGKADAALGELAVFNHLTSKHMMTEVSVTGEVKIGDKELSLLNIAIRKELPVLASILSKGVESIGVEEVRPMKQKWLGENNQKAKGAEIAPASQLALISKGIVVTFGLIALIVIVFWWFRVRNKQLLIKDTMLLISLVFVVLISSIGFFIILIQNAANDHETLVERKDASLGLADELKRSSDELTRFVRLYAITGDARFEGYFNDILAIRDGKKPHPAISDLSYWDQVVAGEILHRLDGEPYSVEGRMKALEFSKKEYQKLSQAKMESDQLAKLEVRAMHAVKGLFIDDQGKFSIDGDPDLKLATELLHGKEYFASKARIMKAIDEFYGLVDIRTNSEIRSAINQERALTLVVTILILFTMAYSLFIFALLKKRIILPLILIKDATRRIAKEDYSREIQVDRSDEFGLVAQAFNVMASRIHQRTSKMKKARVVAEEASRANESLLHDIRQQKLVLDEHAIVGITDVKGAITFANKRFCEISGYSEEELIGQNHRILNSGNQPESYWKAMYKVISRGDIWNGEVMNKAKDGSIYWVDTTIAPFMGMDGKPENYISIRTDITQRKQMEEGMARAKDKAEKSTKELQLKFDELERFRCMAVGRELKMIELKQEVNAHLQEKGDAPRYKIVSSQQN